MSAEITVPIFIILEFLTTRQKKLKYIVLKIIAKDRRQSLSRHPDSSVGVELSLDSGSLINLRPVSYLFITAAAKIGRR